MEYVIIGIVITALVAAIVVALAVMESKKKPKDLPAARHNRVFDQIETQLVPEENCMRELAIKMEMLPADTIPDESKLAEITDSKVLARVNNLIPGLVQAGNAVNNAFFHNSGEVLYRAVIPAGAKLADSKAMPGAVRAIYHEGGKIKGNANLVAVQAQNGTAIAANAVASAMGVASLVVGQYYMNQINSQLEEIGDKISKISDFQDNEYRSRVFSLIAHVKLIADFQAEILENNELRLSKISQLDNLEEECTQLLGQANLTIAGFAKKNDLDYPAYEKEIQEAQKWYIYQQSLIEVLYRISDLKYTLHLGAVSREQCSALLSTYTHQVSETRKELTEWHHSTIERLQIDTTKIRRKKDGFEGMIWWFPGLFNDDLNFSEINGSTVDMIKLQTEEQNQNCEYNATEFYSQDVQLISKDGKLYYLPNDN